ncbi:hypothetical protein Poly41_46450 [Novipirellula artificiosorum]|uniref:Uncharacterized protein n=1 Tax=Novipirellula artificiosorum TaxID=2528016 RepID=A0A5C6DFA2_9BACT|nr:hypothetical protein Poly41_46450 [Novipirellula artificiosorum]
MMRGPRLDWAIRDKALASAPRICVLLGCLCILGLSGLGFVHVAQQPRLAK